MTNIGLDGPYVEWVPSCPTLSQGIVDSGGLNRITNFRTSALVEIISIRCVRQSVAAPYVLHFTLSEGTLTVPGSCLRDTYMALNETTVCWRDASISVNLVDESL